jgi:hypothetical protein
MLAITGYLCLCVAAVFATINFYLSFLRAPIYKLLGRDCPNVSGIPLIGNLFVLVAMLLVERTAAVWMIATLLILIDTGGLPWFLLTVSWMTLRAQIKPHWSKEQEGGRLGSKRI